MLRDEINAALKTAMKARETKTVATLRLVTAALKDRDIVARGEGREDGIGDDEVLSILQKMIKQRRESIKLFEEGGQAGAAAGEAEEITIIEAFMPQPLSAAETGHAIEQLVKEMGAGGIQDMGKVVAELRQRYVGRIDMSKAAPMVKAALS